MNTPQRSYATSIALKLLDVTESTLVTPASLTATDVARVWTMAFGYLFSKHLMFLLTFTEVAMVYLGCLETQERTEFGDRSTQT